LAHPVILGASLLAVHLDRKKQLDLPHDEPQVARLSSLWLFSSMTV
jgi:hypothetical protein